MRNLILFFVIAICSPTFAQKTATDRTAHFNLEKGVAISGYDPVAYFTLNKAVKGSSKFSSVYIGVKYFFANESNKKTFETNPALYEPQYGGWCAFAMGDYGKKVEVDPETFKIVNGKLYLFYNAYLNNTLKSWNKDEKNLMIKADKNWLNFIK